MNRPSTPTSTLPGLDRPAVLVRPVSKCGVALTLWACLACSPDSDGSRTGTDGARPQTITVSAAASLTDAFHELAEAFQAQHPEVRVTMNFAGSAALATQIREGAPVDLFAPADPRHLDAVADELAAPARTFATNRLRIAVPAGNPGGVAGLDDLSREELVVGLCAPGVPCGDLARDALARAGVTPRPDTEEPNARSLLTKVRLGEVDVALVYGSDVLAGGAEVEGIDFPEEWNPTARYAIAALQSEGSAAVVAEFVDFLLSDEGGAILSRYGFSPPSGTEP